MFQLPEPVWLIVQVDHGGHAVSERSFEEGYVVERVRVCVDKTREKRCACTIDVDGSLREGRRGGCNFLDVPVGDKDVGG